MKAQRGRPPRSSAARTATDHAILAALGVLMRDRFGSAQYLSPTLAPTGSGKQSLEAAARAAAELLTEIGAPGASVDNVLRVFRDRSAYARNDVGAIESVDAGFPIAIKSAARILSAREPTTAKEVLIWYQVRLELHRKNNLAAVPSFHPFELVREFARQKYGK